MFKKFLNIITFSMCMLISSPMYAADKKIRDVPIVSIMDVDSVYSPASAFIAAAWADRKIKMAEIADSLAALRVSANIGVTHAAGDGSDHADVATNTGTLATMAASGAQDVGSGASPTFGDVTIGDSLIADTDIAAWDAAADSTGQDVRSTASPTFGGLTMNGNIALGANYISRAGGDSSISIEADGDVAFSEDIYADKVFATAPSLQLRMTDSDDGKYYGFNANASILTVYNSTGSVSPFFINSNASANYLLGIAGTTVTIGTGSQGTGDARLHVKGSGAASTDSTLIIQNSVGANSFTIAGDHSAKFFGDVTIGDSLIADTDIAAWDAAADSVDQDVRSTASPTFAGLTMDGNIDLVDNKLEGTYINAGDAIEQLRLISDNANNEYAAFMVDAHGNLVVSTGNATGGDPDITITPGTGGELHLDGNVIQFDAATNYLGNNMTGADEIYVVGITTASDPGYTFTGDENTGMHTLASDKLAFSTNGIDRIVADVSGNVGIGLVIPTARLHIKGSGATSSTYAVKVDDSASANLFNIRDDGISTFSGTVTVADSFHIGDGVTYSYAVPGDANFTTSSDSTKKCNIVYKTPDKAKQKDRLDAILKIDEAEYNYDRDAIRKKFDPKYVKDVSITKQIDDTTTVIVPYDSMTIVQQDSIMYAWIAKEEKRVDKIASKKRYGPMAQDVATAFGGDGKSINWDRVNSEYRLAVQELIVLVREQQAQIDDLEMRVGILENKNTAIE